MDTSRLMTVLTYGGMYLVVGYITGFVLLACMKTGVVKSWYRLDIKYDREKNRNEVWAACLSFWPYIHLKYFFLTMSLAPEKITECFSRLRNDSEPKKSLKETVEISGDTLLRVHHLLDILETINYCEVSDEIIKKIVAPKLKAYHAGTPDEKRRLTIEIKKEVAKFLEKLLDLNPKCIS